MSANMASMNEFINFHGMLTSPSSAMRCVSSINGVILFMPSNYKDRGISAYQVTNLSTITYYLLVIFSFTGLSTKLQMTEFLESTEDLDKGLNSPEVTDDIIAFISEQSDIPATELKVIRRFSYNFTLPGLKVKMFHLSDCRPNGKLHLVEIYNPPKWWWLIEILLSPIAQSR
jgi:hypothetical protein